MVESVLMHIMKLSFMNLYSFNFIGEISDAELTIHPAALRA